MRGRKPVPEFNHIMLEGNAREVQQNGSDIDFMDSDIVNGGVKLSNYGGIKLTTNLKSFFQA